MKKKSIPRKKLLDLIKHYKKKLGLEDIEINVVVSGETYYCIKKRVSQKKDTSAAVINEDDNKKKYTMIFHTYDELADNVIHELLHIRLWEVFGEQKQYYDMEHKIIDILIPIIK